MFNTIMCETELILHLLMLLGRVEDTPAYQAYLMLGVSLRKTYFQRRRAQKIDYGHPCANAFPYGFVMLSYGFRICYVLLKQFLSCTSYLAAWSLWGLDPAKKTNTEHPSPKLLVSTDLRWEAEQKANKKINMHCSTCAYFPNENACTKKR